MGDEGVVPPPAEIDLSGYKVATSNNDYGFDLQLNGAGFRSKWFFTLYLGALYLETKTDDANKVMNGDEPMMIEMQMISNMVTKEKFN